MKPQRFYLLRHGETVGNVQQFSQLAETPLTTNGERQASLAARRLRRYPIEKVLSSTHTRARQTAELIAQTTKWEIEWEPDLIEVIRPSAVTGKHFQAEGMQDIYETLRENFAKKGYRHSDEENFDDQITRAGRMVTKLQDRSERELLVISHGTFIFVMMMVMSLGKKLTPEHYMDHHRFFKLENTGLAICDFEPKEGWRLVSWNDHAHLAHDTVSW